MTPTRFNSLESVPSACSAVEELMREFHLRDRDNAVPERISSGNGTDSESAAIWELWRVERPEAMRPKSLRDWTTTYNAFARIENAYFQAVESLHQFPQTLTDQQAWILQSVEIKSIYDLSTLWKMVTRITKVAWVLQAISNVFDAPRERQLSYARCVGEEFGDQLRSISPSSSTVQRAINRGCVVLEQLSIELLTKIQRAAQEGPRPLEETLMEISNAVIGPVNELVVQHIANTVLLVHQIQPQIS